MKPMLIAATALSLTGCNIYREAISPRPDTSQPWRAIITDGDRDRLRDWRKAWKEVLPLATAANPKAIAADPALYDPDRATPHAALPPGDYSCRTIKLGASGTATSDYAAFPAAKCAVVDDGGVDRFHKVDGTQRPVGLLFPETDARIIFLGTLVLGDETAPLRYGLDATRDMLGYVERIGDKRWRLVLPYPRFESRLDIIELVAN